MLQDKDMCSEILTLEKNLAVLYHTATQEASTEPLHCNLKSLMNDTLCKQNDTYKLMQQKGWYAPCQAQESAITKLKNKYSAEAQS